MNYLWRLASVTTCLVLAAAVQALEAMTFLMPGEVVVVAVHFPVELASFIWLMAYLVHGIGVIQPAIDHGVSDRF